MNRVHITPGKGPDGWAVTASEIFMTMTRDVDNIDRSQVGQATSEVASSPTPVRSLCARDLGRSEGLDIAAPAGVVADELRRTTPADARDRPVSSSPDPAPQMCRSVINSLFAPLDPKRNL